MINRIKITSIYDMIIIVSYSIKCNGNFEKHCNRLKDINEQ